jgi:hypothetical protein
VPLSKLLFFTPPQPVGTPFVLGGPNLPFRADFSLNFPYSVTTNDYYAGRLQFLYCVTLTLNKNPLAGFGFRHSNPGRVQFGELSWQNLNSSVFRRDDLEYLNQQVQLLGHPIALARQEAARPKTMLLGNRPRFLLSNAALIRHPVDGRFAPPILAYNGGGTITSGTPGVFTESGSISQVSVPQPTVEIPSRSFRMDVQDGDISFVPVQENADFYLNSAYQNLADTWRPANIGIFLLPGITGQLQIEVFKLTEQATGDVVPSFPPVYTPVSSFPTP